MTDVVLDVKVIPRSRRTAFGLTPGPDSPLIVRLAATAVDGAASDALVGVTPDQIRAKIARCLPTS